MSIISLPWVGEIDFNLTLSWSNSLKAQNQEQAHVALFRPARRGPSHNASCGRSAKRQLINHQSNSLLVLALY